MIDKRYLPSLSLLFKGSSIRKITASRNISFVKNILLQSGYFSEIDSTSSLSQVFNDIYRLLINNYRNEYVYKNAIVNKILLGHYSLNTSSMISELRVNRCKADIVILNGTSTVYEIKTKYDKLDRLRDQLKAYSDFFDRIYVVTDESLLDKIIEIIDEHVGIMVLSNRYTLTEHKKPKSNKCNVSPISIMCSLRKNEYLGIIKKEYDFIPDVPNTKIFGETLKLFSNLTPQKAHDEMVVALKNRASCIELQSFISKMPESLRFSCINSQLKDYERKTLGEILKIKYQSFQEDGSICTSHI